MTAASRVVTELEEQPASTAAALRAAIPILRPWIKTLDPELPLLLVARGSSDNAALYARYALALRSGRDSMLALPSVTTLYQRPPLRRGGVLAVSQSGRSPDLVEVVSTAARDGHPTLVITNDPDSPLAHAADSVVPLHIGKERAVAATKSYTASITVLAALAAIDEGGDAGLKELEHAVTKLGEVVETPVSDAAIELIGKTDRLVVIGRSYNLATAREIALKLQELTGILVAAMSPADLAHGPIRAVGPSTPVIAIAPPGVSAATTAQGAALAQQRGAPVLAIGTGLAQAGVVADLTLNIPSVPEWLTPLLAIVPGQRLAIGLSHARGLDPDAPTGLSKVTRTR